MTIVYKIDENDFLIHQLYTASKSERIRKKRRNSKIFVPVAYVVFGISSIYNEEVYLGIIFIIIALLWFFIYPLWQRRHYINHYKSFIKENFRDRLDRTGTLEITNDLIIAKDEGSESKISTTELKKIEEIPSAIFVKLKLGQSIILPKNKINEIGSLTKRLKELANYLNIEYTVDDKWEWK